MRTLYPAIKPYVTHSINVDDPFELHVEECGNPSGIPILFVHGGPGAGCEPYHRCFFDPEIYRIILFDQRGCGKSGPHAELEGNTTQALLQDIETIRVRLEISEWILFGGSWGSTLSLLYAQSYPEHTLGLILRGIFLCRPEEINWFYQDGASRIFPDYWLDFVKPIPLEERSDMVGAYYKRLTGNDEIARMAAAKAWSVWEGRCATLKPNKNVIHFFSEPHTAFSLARIECHYFKHNSFLEPNQILNNVHKLSNIPGIIVHGRYDVVCPLESAWELHSNWPNSQLHIISDAGHAASEPAIVDALVRATQAMSRNLK